MSLEKWQPLRDMQVLQNRMNRLFNHYFDRDVDSRSDLSTSWYPATNIIEKKDDYVLKIEVPGMNQEDIHIEFKDSSLIISGERRQEKEINEENFHLIESQYGKFSRSFILPKDVDHEKIKAALKNGILELTVPKSEEKKPKSISISVE
jgi:HSP20 family protein